MNEKVVSMREMQRNYRGLINRVKKTKQPVYLVSRSKREAVLLDIEVFEEMKGKTQKQKKISWQEMKKRLDWIASGGRQDVNLGQFIHDDRQRHVI